MRAKEKIIKEAGTHEIPIGDFVVHVPNTKIAMDLWAAKKVAERDMQIKEFLFNTHRVVEDKIVLNLADVLKLFTPKP